MHFISYDGESMMRGGPFHVIEHRELQRMPRGAKLCVSTFYLRDRFSNNWLTHSSRNAPDRCCELLNLAYAEHCMLEGP